MTQINQPHRKAKKPQPKATAEKLLEESAISERRREGGSTGAASVQPMRLTKEQLAKYKELRKMLAQWRTEDAKLTEDTWPQVEKLLAENPL